METVSTDPFRAARLVLHLRQEGITEDSVLSAMEQVDRGDFVEGQDLKALGFSNCMLPIPCGQVLPRPLVTARLLQALALKPGNVASVLVVGIGSGYLPALVARMAKTVSGIERYERLTDQVRQKIVQLGIENLAVRRGDMFEGWPERGPYDRILLTGAVEAVPHALYDQLEANGRIIVPLKGPAGMGLVRMTPDKTSEWLGSLPALPPLLAGPSQAL